jgi:two-component system chemotaxis response regulator CheB
VHRDVIVIGASAGGVEALRTVVRGLPADLPAAVLVVLHTPANGAGVLPHILSRSGALPARHPADNEPLGRSVIWVASPDHHLVVLDGHVTLTRGPRENGLRPAADVLFRTAARARGARVIGVVLSGALDDGTAGLTAVVGRGGVAVVQDPADALYEGMPSNALAGVPVDHVLPAAEIPALLQRLCLEDIGDQDPVVARRVDEEADVALMDDDARAEVSGSDAPSGYSCPDCSGVLWEVPDATLVRYRCRVGHAWSAEGLLGQQAEQLDGALWMALRVLEEKAALAVTLRDRADERGNAVTAGRFAEQAAEATDAAGVIRTLIQAHLGAPEGSAPHGAGRDRIGP